ncbi:MAG: translation initiation factor IF-3 [Cytophagales bacterium]|nr:MAG: translation initiation factor IF-3 [Cytophagales bacterium]TAF60884.1 MAG: translation initiation factor IF-3 [Cytophagales bacterium]
MKPFQPRFQNNKVQEETHKINRRIKAPQVRLVGDNVAEPGIYGREDAIKMAEDQNLDLVEISPNAEPPVCKIVDYSKFKYEQKKKDKELKAKNVKVVVKEIRFTPNTDDHDFEFKCKHAIAFLKEGNKVKAYVQFVGRAIVFKDRGLSLLNRFMEVVDDYGKVDGPFMMEGKRMIAMLSPKKAAAPSTPKKPEKPERVEKVSPKDTDDKI